MGKNLDILLKIVGQVDKTIPQSLREISEETRKLKIRKQELEKQKKIVENEMRLKKELRSQISAMQANRNALKSLELAKKSGVILTKQEEERYRQLTIERKKLDKQVLSNYNSYKKYRMEVQKLKIPYDQLQREIDQSINKMKDLENQQKRMKAQGQITNYFGGVKNKIGAFKDNVVQKVKTTAMVGAGMATAGIITSAKSYIEFDKQMRKVKAISGATEEEFKMLSAEAERLGNTTKFTSAEAADGMEKFALAGFKPKQITEVLSGVLELAAASGEDFVMISDIISDHMKAFGLQTKDTGYMVDVLANTMSNSNVNIEQLGETLKFLSASAQNLKIDLSTTAAATGLMGDAAVKSGMAGRNLKSALSAMANEKVQQKMKALGITVKDSKGNFIGLANVIRQIDKATSKMGDVKKLGVLKELFGEQGELAISKLLTAEKEIDGIIYRGAEALKKFAAQNHNAQGKAKEMVDVMMSGEGGAWDLFTSAIDSLKLTIGKIFFDSGGLDWLKTITKYINELVNVLKGQFTDEEVNVFMQNLVKTVKDLWEAFKEVGKALFSVAKFINTIGIDNILLFITVFNITSKIITFVGAIQKATTVVKAAGGIIAAFKAGIAALGGPIALIVASIITGAYLIYKNWDKIKVFFSWLWKNLKGAAKIVYDIFTIIFNDLWSLVKWYFNLVISFWKGNYEAIKAIYTGVWESIKFVMKLIANGVKTYINIIIAVWKGNYEAIKAIYTGVWESIKFVMKLIANGVKTYINIIIAVWKGNYEAIKAIYTGVWESIKFVMKLIANGVKTYINIIIAVWKGNYEAIKAIYTEVWESIKFVMELIANGVKTYINIIIAVWKGNYEAIKAIYTGVWESIKFVMKLIANGVKTYINIIIAVWKGNYEAIKAIYTEVWESIKFVMELIANGVKTYINIIIAVWKSIVGIVKVVFSNIWDFLTGKTSSISEMFLNMWRDITSSFRNIWDGVKNYVSDIVNNMLEKISSFKENFKNKVLEIVGSIPGLSFFVKAKKEVDGSHKAGLAYVPYDGYIAELHKGERVLTAEENGSLYNELLNTLSHRKENTEKNINTKNSNPITIHFNPTFNGVSSDTAKDIIVAMQSKIEELENILKRVLEKGETDARISL